VDTWWIGLFLILALVLVKPLIRRMSHNRELRALGFPGANVTRSFLGFHGLRVERAGWAADVEFRPRFEKGGHTHFRADLRRPTPDVEFRTDQGGALALTPQGDEAFAERLLTAETRDRLLRLGALGGRLWYVRGGILEIVGPLLSRAEELGPYLERCAEVADGVAASLKENA
jgi:hypothetical protein